MRWLQEDVDWIGVVAVMVLLGMLVALVLCNLWMLAEVVLGC